VFVSRARIESFRQEGKSWREIAEKLNTSTATARRAYAAEVPATVTKLQRIDSESEREAMSPGLDANEKRGPRAHDGFVRRIGCRCGFFDSGENTRIVRA
jgi:hypothetical protein